MLGQRAPQRLRRDGGFTIVELLIYMVIAIVVIGGVYQMLIGQNRLYIKQREMQDVRATLRASGNLLAFEFRQASSASGDLYFISQDSFAVRSIQAAGVICGEHKNKLRYGIWGVSGEFFETSDDSALVFASGDVGTGDDVWKIVAVDKLWDPSGGGVSTCAWGDTLVGKGKGKGSATGVDPVDGTGTPELVVEVLGDMDDVYIGAPFKSFRRIQYGAFQQNGRWWLGRRVGSAAAYELLTGPLRPPSDSGLVFTYYDRFGNVTTAADSVKYLDILLRGESLGNVPRPGEAPSAQADTLTIRVSLRG